jgi:ubiquinone/menaquinone biosynthesis C-methylase UbiE
MNKIETAGADFKTADAASYDAHVQTFARFSAELTTPLARRLVEMANISTNQRVLDVGTGTGVVALEAAKAISSAGECVGVDLSEKMFAAARAEADRRLSDGPIKFLKMDAESLQFESACFDVVLSLFAVLHFPNPEIALNEMYRVLKPGGRLVVGIGSAPPWFSLVGLRHAMQLVPKTIALLCGYRLVGPGFLERLIEETIPAGSEPEESALARTGRNRTRALQRLVRDAGFLDLREDWEGHEATLKTPADFWDIQRTFSSIARKRLNRATPEQVVEVRTKFDARCQQVLARSGKLVYPVGAFFVAAKKPEQSR